LPTLFVKRYTLPKDCVLYQDLRRLQVRRNAIAHLKEEVTQGDEIVHPGDHPAVADDEHRFMGRCRTLTAELMRHVVTFDDSSAAHELAFALTLRR